MTARRWPPAAGVGLVLTAGVALATFAVVGSTASVREAQLAKAAANEANRLIAVIDRNVVEMERLAVLADDVPTFRRLSQARLSMWRELRIAALAGVDGRRLVVETAVPADVGPLSTGNDLRTMPTFSAVLDRVLTEADATAGTPYDVNGREFIAVAAPRLEIVDAPESTLRRSVVGAVIGGVDVQRLFDSRWSGDIQLTAPNGVRVGDDATGDVLE